MKKILILTSVLSSLFAYSQMRELAIFNKSNTYEFRGKITAGDFTGSNCALKVNNFSPSIVKGHTNEEIRYVDFKGQFNSSIAPIGKWQINDGLIPPYVVMYDDPILSYTMPNITKWASVDIQMIDPNSGAVMFSGTIQDPTYPCASNPSTLTSTGLPTNVNIEWVVLPDLNSGELINMIIITEF